MFRICDVAQEICWVLIYDQSHQRCRESPQDLRVLYVDCGSYTELYNENIFYI